MSTSLAFCTTEANHRRYKSAEELILDNVTYQASENIKYQACEKNSQSK